MPYSNSITTLVESHSQELNNKELLLVLSLLTNKKLNIETTKWWDTELGYTKGLHLDDKERISKWWKENQNILKDIQDSLTEEQAILNLKEQIAILERKIHLESEKMILDRNLSDTREFSLERTKRSEKGLELRKEFVADYQKRLSSIMNEHFTQSEVQEIFDELQSSKHKSHLIEALRYHIKRIEELKSATSDGIFDDKLGALKTKAKHLGDRAAMSKRMHKIRSHMADDDIERRDTPSIESQVGDTTLKIKFFELNMKLVKIENQLADDENSQFDYLRTEMKRLNDEISSLAQTNSGILAEEISFFLTYKQNLKRINMVIADINKIRTDPIYIVIQSYKQKISESSKSEDHQIKKQLIKNLDLAIIEGISVLGLNLTNDIELICQSLGITEQDIVDLEERQESFMSKSDLEQPVAGTSPDESSAKKAEKEIKDIINDFFEGKTMPKESVLKMAASSFVGQINNFYGNEVITIEQFKQHFGIINEQTSANTSSQMETIFNVPAEPEEQKTRSALIKELKEKQSKKSLSTSSEKSPTYKISNEARMASSMTSIKTTLRALGVKKLPTTGISLPGITELDTKCFELKREIDEIYQETNKVDVVDLSADLKDEELVTCMAGCVAKKSSLGIRASEVANSYEVKEDKSNNKLLFTSRQKYVHHRTNPNLDRVDNEMQGIFGKNKLSDIEIKKFQENLQLLREMKSESSDQDQRTLAEQLYNKYSGIFKRSDAPNVAIVIRDDAPTMTFEEAKDMCAKILKYIAKSEYNLQEVFNSMVPIINCANRLLHDEQLENMRELNDKINEIKDKLPDIEFLEIYISLNDILEKEERDLTDADKGLIKHSKGVLKGIFEEPEKYHTEIIDLARDCLQSLENAQSTHKPPSSP